MAKPMCYRCRYASERFRWGKATYHICNHPDRPEEEDPREAAVRWCDTCPKFEPKQHEAPSAPEVTP